MKTLTLAAQISVGGETELSLSKAQLATRVHLVDIVKKAKDGSALVKVKSGVVLQFKAGETLTLDERGLSKSVLRDLQDAEDAAVVAKAKADADARETARQGRLAPLRAAVDSAMFDFRNADAAVASAKPDELDAAKVKLDAAQKALTTAENALADAEKTDA